jgi:glucose-1-phosphatase
VTTPQSIEVILFDLGGVLVELAGVPKMLEWSDATSADELWRRWLQSEVVRGFESGTINKNEFAAGVVREFGLRVGPAEFIEAFRVWPRALFPGARELLAELAPNYRLASVSNTNAMHWEERICGDWSLHSAFHYNFPSHQLGKLKPDHDYFQHVLDAVGAPAARVLFVDDNSINVESAASLGLHARCAVGIDGARRVFDQFGLRRGRP